ncbi:hypothetical protein N665_5135s0002 [Sinapis alba]|nr:hypothetical protein N665_5135s0002 [Sinapis alba]
MGHCDLIMKRIFKDENHMLRETFKFVYNETSAWVTYKDHKSFLEKFDINGLMQTKLQYHCFWEYPITRDAFRFWTVRLFQKMEVWMPVPDEF